MRSIRNPSKRSICFILDRIGGWIIFVGLNDCLRIIGITPTGRATVAALAMNRERIVTIRAADYEIGRHPPLDDR